jgi:hypothetical protein
MRDGSCALNTPTLGGVGGEGGIFCNSAAGVENWALNGGTCQHKIFDGTRAVISI